MLSSALLNVSNVHLLIHTDTHKCRQADARMKAKTGGNGWRKTEAVRWRRGQTQVYSQTRMDTAMGRHIQAKAGRGGGGRRKQTKSDRGSRRQTEAKVGRRR